MCVLPRPILAVLATMAAVNAASAQDFPARPITMIAPFAAGGPTDTLARIVAEQMKVSLGQPVIIENVVGGAAALGVGRAARAVPDGHTIIIGNVGSHVINGAVQTLPYDLLNDFTPIARLADNPLLIASKTSVPASDLAGLIAWIKANPGRVTAGTSGAGAVSHVSGLLFENRTGTQLQYIPYRGAGPALQDVAAGHIDLMFDQISNSLPFARSGKIKVHAIAADARVAAAPDIPTTDQAGLPGFHVSVWHAIWAPKGTPAAVVARLNAVVLQTLQAPEVRQRLADLGQEIPAAAQLTPQALAAHHKLEIKKWWPVVKAAALKLE
jgi:tripartite-type tricarboxylate transporter receptor subunit TctC